MTHDLQARIRRLGAVFDHSVLDATRAAYRPLVDPAPVREQPGLAYGTHGRQVLDLYWPSEGKPRGHVLFVHGGGFTGGDKDEDGCFHGNVGRFFARRGLACAVMNYRRAPQHAWPAAAHDVRDAANWQRAQGELAKLPFFVLGQSAGACHVASWLFDDASRGGALGAVAGVLLMSGYYHAVPPLAPHLKAYFGEVESDYERRSPLLHVRSPLAAPLWLSVAELDPGTIAARTHELAAQVALANGRAPQCVWFAGHNHVSTVCSLGTPQTGVGDAIVDFIDARLKERAP